MRNPFVQLRDWLLVPVLTRINLLENAMTSREQTARDQLLTHIDQIKAGWASLKTENSQLRAALAASDADRVRAVDEALAADSEHDADAIEQVDASLAELLAPVSPAVPAPGEPDEPAPTGTTPLPSDDGGVVPADPAPADPEPIDATPTDTAADSGPQTHQPT